MIPIVVIVSYGLIGGGVFAFYVWLWPIEPYATHTDGSAQGFAAAFWPLSLPAIVSYRLLKILFNRIEAKREATAKEAEELKKRVEELERELREEKKP